MTLLSGQQDLQNQSLDLIQNMTRWCVYDNLMRDITIYDRTKHGFSWLDTTNWESSCIE